MKHGNQKIRRTTRLLSFKVGDIIVGKSEKDPYWEVVLYAKKSMMKRGYVSVTIPGLYSFYGKWYGHDPLKISSYGKISWIDEKHCTRIGNVKDFPLEVIEQHVGAYHPE